MRIFFFMGILLLTSYLPIKGLLKKHALAKAKGPPAVFPAFAGPTPPKATKAGSGFAQAGRPLAVLTYSVYVPGTKFPAALPEKKHVLACTGWAGETVGLFEQAICS
jgi:hypothetical protein